MDDYERLAKELVDTAAEGCCQNGQWRGRLCSYHEGYRDGVWAAEAALLDASQNDGSQEGQGGDASAFVAPAPPGSQHDGPREAHDG